MMAALLTGVNRAYPYAKGNTQRKCYKLGPVLSYTLLLCQVS